MNDLISLEKFLARWNTLEEINYRWSFHTALLRATAFMHGASRCGPVRHRIRAYISRKYDLVMHVACARYITVLRANAICDSRHEQRHVTRTIFRTKS